MDYPTTQIHGPFTHHKVSVDGYLVPHLDVTPLTGTNDGSVNVSVTHQIVLADADEARKWIPLIAHALAVGAGYTCHGANCERANPHKIQLMQIGEAERE